MQYNLLDKIKTPEDIKGFTNEQLKKLSDEIRHCLIDTISKNGGHLASNLGAVELTVALHKAFNSPKDKILFDVGHQCYTHKLLTGRFNRFNTVRKENGLSGFMRPDESEYDPFVTGHSSNSLSAAYGIYKGEQIAKNEKNYAVCVVGDGALTGGMLFEALNNTGSEKNDSLIVVLNDNKMSISKNVGSLARYLSVIRTKPGYHRFKHGLQRAILFIPFLGKRINKNLLRSKNMIKDAIYHSNVFEHLGYHYLGPVDGHNFEQLERILKVAKEQTRPVLVHVLTVKGKGYQYAEESPNHYHGVSPFDIEQGSSLIPKADYSAVVGDELCNLAKTDEKLCVITAAMTEGTGLKEFANRYADRFFDVGIAEEHATTFMAGLAAGGAHPVFCVYSSFLQRAYDQMIHDVAISNLPVTVCVDRAGIVGEDGETHQGVFDIAFLKTIPNIRIYSPTSYAELKWAISDSVYNVNGPSVVRYPRGVQPELPEDFEFTSDDFCFYGDCTSKTVVITFGRTFAAAAETFTKLKQEGIPLAILKLNRIYPISNEVYSVLEKFNNILIFEEGIKSGGINETLCSGLLANGAKANVKVFAVDDEFIPHMSVDSALKKYKLDADSIYKIIKNEENNGE